jgi:glutamyl-tRNA synthetase
MFMVRTRFAPSPTGYLHVGGLRTALYCYLFAHKNKGKFILRIEDTDQKRYVEGAVENLLKTLEWVGLTYDEGPHKDGGFGPYVQSERTDLYRKHAEILLEKGAAYRCFCTPERLEQMREKQTKLKQAPMYDRTCCKLSKDEVETKMKEGIPFVIRQKIPHGQKIMFKDHIRGIVTFDSSTIDDQVLMKSDNFPTYHLANVVDDHFMEITHVIRGEEWLPSTPKHILLYAAFDWKTPEYAHLPLLLNKDKTKLSKRQGDVSVEDYIHKGYSREAIINFIALLGWHPGGGIEKEMFTLEELVETFDIAQIHKAGAVFDLEKLDWFNFQWNKKNYMEKLEQLAREVQSDCMVSINEKKETTFKFSSPDKEKMFTEVRGGILYEKVKTVIPQPWNSQGDRLRKGLITIEEKVLKSPSESAIHLKFYFEPSPFNRELMLNPKMKVEKDIAENALKKSLEALKSLDNYENPDAIKDCLMKVVADLGYKNGQVFWPVRVALTNEQFTPGVFEVIWALGKEETLKRLEGALQDLK